ncbi:hypothetical protein [Bacillus sp. C1]
MIEIINVSLYFILFILIVAILCFILLVFMKIFGKNTNEQRPMKKERPELSSGKDTAEYKHSEITTKDAEADWMDAVMTTAFVVTAMKNANEDANIDHTSHHHDSTSHDDAFDSGDS